MLVSIRDAGGCAADGRHIRNSSQVIFPPLEVQSPTHKTKETVSTIYSLL